MTETSLSSLQILVLDEADRMLEENFEEQMREIIKQCATTRQTMLFSATMTSQVRELAIMSLKDPVKVIAFPLQISLTQLYAC